MFQGLFGPPRQSALELALLPLISSEELDDNSSALNTGDILQNSQGNPLRSPPDHTDLLAENPSRDFYLELNAEDNSNTLNINLLTEDLIDPMEGSPCPYPENLPSFDAILCLHDSTTSSFTPFPEQYVMNQDPLASPSDVFLFDEDAEEEDGLPSTINDLIENVTILDEIRSLNLSLEEGFSPEMVARLDEEGCLYPKIGQQETDQDNDHSCSSMMVAEDRGQARSYQKGNKTKKQKTLCSKFFFC